MGIKRDLGCKEVEEGEEGAVGQDEKEQGQKEEGPISKWTLEPQ